MTRVPCAIVLLIAVTVIGGCQWVGGVTKPVGRALKVPYDLTVGQLFGPKEQSEDVGVPIAPADAYRIGFNAPRWTTDLGLRSSDELVEATILGDVIACVDRPSNMVTSIRASDGAMLWQAKAGADTDLLFEPVRLGDEILINTETRLLHLSMDTGRTVGYNNLEAAVADRPVVIGKLAVFGGLNGRVFAHNTVTGYSSWSRQMSAGIMVRPVATGYRVFVADSNGVYGMFDARAGDSLWKGVTYGQISAVPVVTTLGVFVACEDQTMYALDRSSGNDKWKYMAASALKSPPTVIRNTLFLPDPDRGLVAMDAVTGGELWTKDTAATPITIAGGRLLLNDRTRLLAVDPASGKTIAEVPVAPLKTVLLGPKGSLILVGARGRLVRLDPQR